MARTKGLLIVFYKTTTKNTSLFFKKGASSNLLVDKIKSILAFRINELVLISRDEFPYRSV